MTSLLERAITFLAPDACIICSNTHNIICINCQLNIPRLELPFCVICTRPAVNWRICDECDRNLAYVWPAALYENDVATLIQKMKYQRARTATQACAGLLDKRLPPLCSWTVTAAPTAPQRVRRRGFDQAVLIAKTFAQHRQLDYKPLLRRLTSSRQVGATRNVRQQQASAMFYATKKAEAVQNVLIIDDVCTTGATLQAAAAALRAAGVAGVIGAAVVAYKNK